MSRLIVAGSKSAAEAYIADYKTIHLFKPYQIKMFEDKIKIEDARLIRKILSVKVQERLLIVIDGEITPACQNALLKSIEESDEKVHFIFCVRSFENLLSTIRSRCQEVSLAADQVIDETFYLQIKEMAGLKDSWKGIEKVSEFTKANDIVSLIPVLRKLMLENLGDREKISDYYLFCKRMLTLLPLSTNNNVNDTIILEKVFATST